MSSALTRMSDAFISPNGGAGLQLELLARQVRDSPPQKALVAQLRLASRERGRELDDIALRTSYAQKMGCLARFHQAGKAESLQRITSLRDQVIERAEARLAKRSAAVRASQTRSGNSSTTTRLLGTLTLVAALGQIGRPERRARVWQSG